MKIADFNKIVLSVVNGGLPNFTGQTLTEKQVQEMKVAIEFRKNDHSKMLDEYFETQILNRLKK